MGSDISYDLTNFVIDSSDTNPVHVVNGLKKKEKKREVKYIKKSNWNCILFRLLEWYIDIDTGYNQKILHS